ncbi:MAG: DUF3422 family protein [Hyphomicrobiaceae bacterium]
MRGLMSVPEFEQHPERRTVLDEMHVRPFLPYSSPRRFYHYAFVLDPAQVADEPERFAVLCSTLGAKPPPVGARFHNLILSDWSLRWELHAEFSTYTWTTGEGIDEPFAPTSAAALEQFHGQIPLGRLLVWLELALISHSEGSNRPEQNFDRASLTVIEAADGLARVASDFRQAENGSVRILVEDFGLSPARAGRLVQRLLEMETYRCLALLGLPAARRSDPTVRGIEQALLEASRELTSESGPAKSHDLLRQLTALSAELEATIAGTSYRFGATRAYADLVRARLEVIREKEYAGYTSFSRFLRRRFNPAIATCAMLEARQKALSDRLSHAVDLLRTRIQLEVEQQNRALLASMNRRSRLQLRLQQTVEGLSVAAISYYVVGLISYAIKGLKDAMLLPEVISPALMTALSVPFVIVCIWWLLHRARREWSKRQSDDQAE